MNALGTALVWVCAAIVALPLSPCAFFSSGCCPHEEAAPAEPAAEHGRPCCAEHEPPAQPRDHSEQERPCSSACCQLSPFVPVDKVLLDVHPSDMLAVLPPVADVHVDRVAAQPVALRPPVPLQVLHCQWRN